MRLLCVLAICLAFDCFGASQTQTQTRPQTQSQPQTYRVPRYKLQVYGPPNFRDPLSELSKIFERTNPDWKVDLETPGNAEIIGHLKTKTPIDVFLLSGQKEITDLMNQKLILADSVDRIASDEIVIVGPSTATAEIKQPKDLVYSDLKGVALFPENRSFGKACRDYLTKTGVMPSLTGKIVEVKTAHEALEKMKSGDVQWTFVDSSIAADNPELKILWHVPATEIPVDIYFAAIPAYSTHVAAAKRYLAIVDSTIAGMLFKNAGYIMPQTQPRTQTQATAEPQTRPAHHPHAHKKKKPKVAKKPTKP